MMSGLIKALAEKKSVIYIIIVIALLVGVVITAGFKDIILIISKASLYLILLASAVYTLSFLVRGFRYKSIISGMGYTESFSFLTTAVLYSQFANLVLPARTGDLIRPVLLNNRRKIAYSTGVVSLVTERAFDIVSIILIGLISFTIISLFYTNYEFPDWVGYIVYIFLLILLGLLFFLILILYKADSTKLLINRLILIIKIKFFYTDKVINFVNNFVDTLNKSVRNKGSFMFIISQSIGVWLLEVLTGYLVLVSLGLSAPVEIVALAISFGNMIKVLPTTPGSIGTYEAALSSVYIISNIPLTFALSAALIDHFIRNAMTFILGLIVLTRAGIRIEDLKNSKSKILEEQGY